MSAIESIIHKFLILELAPGEASGLDTTTRLITGRLLDSISTLKLISFLEDEFKVEFDAHELDVDYLDTIADIARVVAGKQAG